MKNLKLERQWLHNIMNALNATELYTVKRLTARYVNFTSIKILFYNCGIIERYLAFALSSRSWNFLSDGVTGASFVLTRRLLVGP